MQPPKLPAQCPSCGSGLHVKALHCPNCSTEVNGSFALPVLLMLSPDDQEFLFNFLKASGSLKEMAKLLGRSYPSVRNRLDEVIARVNELEKNLSHE
ncbi:MAG: DUF2089 family protein [Bacteroidetes bacterium]|nr:DUF2089 family protein [Bacteroidota bacterium]